MILSLFVVPGVAHCSTAEVGCLVATIQKALWESPTISLVPITLLIPLIEPASFSPPRRYVNSHKLAQLPPLDWYQPFVSSPNCWIPCAPKPTGSRQCWGIVSHSDSLRVCLHCNQEM